MVVDYTKSEYIKYLDSENKYDAIEELAQVFSNSGVCKDVKVLISALHEREEIMSTGIGWGMAIPHAKLDSINEMAFAIGISKKGIEFDSLDGNPVHLIILVAAGEDQHKDYLRLLSNILAILKNEKAKDKIIGAATPEELMNIMKREAKKLA